MQIKVIIGLISANKKSNARRSSQLCMSDVKPQMYTVQCTSQIDPFWSTVLGFVKTTSRCTDGETDGQGATQCGP